MFQGATALNLDVKGRLAIPARHREALVAASEGRLVLTAHLHHCLLLYPATAWEPIRDQLLAVSSFNKQSAAIQRVMVCVDSPSLKNRSGWSVWAVISKSGRMPAGSNSWT